MVAELPGAPKPVVEPLAAYVPHDMLYVHFHDLRTLVRLAADLDELVTPLVRVLEEQYEPRRAAGGGGAELLGRKWRVATEVQPHRSCSRSSSRGQQQQQQHQLQRRRKRQCSWTRVAALRSAYPAIGVHHARTAPESPASPRAAARGPSGRPAQAAQAGET